MTPATTRNSARAPST
ncbi:Protein of unknown function [Lactobacillus delbrueckii subsp. bulgaricus]|nr:Protein of unknown function [Lactobacillus delbrueckii subsp. bulgaricus]